MSMAARQEAIARAAARYRFSTFVLAVLLFPFQLVGWTAALVWLVVSFAWAAVAVSFSELNTRMRRSDRGQ